LLHIKLLRSPYPHAKILSIDKTAALSVPGVQAVLTFEDAPDRLFSTARHEKAWMDPDDTRVLDDVVRFIGQKVAAVIAETEAAAEEGCRRLKVDYGILPAVIDPAQAISSGAPAIHSDKTREQRVANGQRNIVAETHGEYGDVAGALAKAAVTYQGTFTTQRVQHAALETHGGLAWVDPQGVLNVRSSTQVPFLTRRALADIFDLAPDKVRVFCERVGGGFGGKQEMFVEDILALAAIRTGRPVKLEFTREEQFISTSTRHPMRITVKAGADSDGKLTALQLDVLSNTGAYGNHAGPVLFHACGESLGVYNCANKKVDAVVAYTNTVPSGAFRGYGLPQTLFAVEAAIDELAKGLGISPYEILRRNIVKPGDPMLSPPGPAHADVLYGSYGLDQCLDLVERAMQADSPQTELSADWLTGEGIALTMIDTVPPEGSATAPRRYIARSRRPRWRQRSTRSACCSPTPRMAVTIPAPMAAPERLSPDARRRPRRKIWPTISGFLPPPRRKQTPIPASSKTMPWSAAGNVCRMFSSRKPRARKDSRSPQPVLRQARRVRSRSTSRAFASP
jgi:putative selenate reductase molybdopterin-binding subunit